MTPECRPISRYYCESEDRQSLSHVPGRTNGEEEIWFIPWQYHGENSEPYIEHRKGGLVTQIVNMRFVSDVLFKTA